MVFFLFGRVSYMYQCMFVCIYTYTLIKGEVFWDSCRFFFCSTSSLFWNAYLFLTYVFLHNRITLCETIYVGQCWYSKNCSRKIWCLSISLTSIIGVNLSQLIDRLSWTTCEEQALHWPWKSLKKKHLSNTKIKTINCQSQSEEMLTVV